MDGSLVAEADKIGRLILDLPLIFSPDQKKKLATIIICNFTQQVLACD